MSSKLTNTRERLVTQPNALPQATGQPSDAAIKPATTSRGYFEDGVQHNPKGGPGTAFMNALLGLDRNADGRIDSKEFKSGKSQLNALASDGVGHDAWEAGVMQALLESESMGKGTILSYQVKNGKVHTSVSTCEGTKKNTFTHAELRLNNALALKTGKLRGINVGHSNDPGDFYCEHLFFASQLKASEPSSSVKTNKAGEKLVGFMHIREDKYAGSSSTMGYTQAERHKDLRKLVGAGLKGYYEDIKTQSSPDQPMKMMVTGFGPYQSIKNNATGDFVSHQENVDASMKEAFGSALLNPKGKLVDSGTNPPYSTYSYRICDPVTREERDIEVTAAKFDVKDASISPDNRGSIQGLMTQVCPDAVMSLGVNPNITGYEAEHRADAGELDRSGSAWKHDNKKSKNQSLVLHDNYSLSRALIRGAQ